MGLRTPPPYQSQPKTECPHSTRLTDEPFTLRSRGSGERSWLSSTARSARGAAAEHAQDAPGLQPGVAYPAARAARTAGASSGARAASRATVSVTYLQAAEVPIPTPAASLANVSPVRKEGRPVWRAAGQPGPRAAPSSTWPSPGR